MAVYWFNFTPNPADSAGLSPTFLNFIKFDGTTLAPPGITQTNAGTGIYQFNYTPSFSIAFRIDGLTTSLGAYRYVSNSIDVDDQAFAPLIGNQTSIYGGASLDPTTLFGYMKRIQEFLEGNQTFNKTSGAWNIFARANATLLISKALANDSTGVTRS